MRKFIAMIVVISILIGMVPVYAADRYEALANQIASIYDKNVKSKNEYFRGYWASNRPTVISNITKLVREAQGLTEAEWQAFSKGLSDVAGNDIFVFDHNHVSDMRGWMYSNGWNAVEEYWRTKDNAVWTYDADADYSNEVTGTLRDTLLQIRNAGYKVTDEVLSTMPVRCAGRINDLNLSRQELAFMVYKLKSTLLTRPEYVGTEDIGKTVDDIDYIFSFNIQETRRLRTALLQKFEGGEPSPWAKQQVAEAIARRFVPKNIQGNYQKVITRGEFASLLTSVVFAWQVNERNGVDYPDIEGRSITKEMYLSNIKVIDSNFKEADSPDLELAYLLGFINENSSSAFMPDKPITRQEAAVMLVNYFHSTLYFDKGYSLNNIMDLDKAAPWARDALILSYEKGLMNGTSNNRKAGTDMPGKGTVDPLGSFTREQAIVTVNRIYSNCKAEVNMPLIIRGSIVYDPTVDYEVSKDSITALRLNSYFPGSSYSIMASKLLNHDKFKAFSGATTPEQIVAMSFGEINSYDFVMVLACKMDGSEVIGWLGLDSYINIGLPVPEEIIPTLFSGKNHLIDLGWATVEINGAGFIYKYKLKNNGYHTLSCYEGVKATPKIYKLIK